MAYQTGGSFAGGFMTAFLAAQNLRMRREHYKTMDDYYRKLAANASNNVANTPSGVAQPAHDAVLNNQNPSYGGRRDTGSARASGPSATGAGGDKWSQYNAHLRNGDPQSALRLSEGMRTEPYKDVNALRVGYGSDTYTTPDGKEHTVDANTRVSQDDADRDLARRTSNEYQGSAANQVGSQAFTALPPSAQSALTSVMYNYGKMPADVVTAAQKGDVQGLAAAISAHANDNGGINSDRRRAEAAAVLGQPYGSQVAASPQQLSSAAPAQAIPTAPLPPPRPADLNPPAPTPVVQPAPPPPQGAIPVSLPSDQASNDEPAMGAKKGGPVTRQSYSHGGIVKGYALGGSADDQDDQDEAEDQQEQFMLNRSTGTPSGMDGTPLLEQPPASAIPTQAQDASMATGGGGSTQVASANPYGMGSLPRIGAGLGGSGMRMGGGRMPSGRGGLGARDDPSSYYAGDNERPEGVPEIADQDGNLASGAAAALTGGLRFLSKFVGGQPGGIPGDQNQANAHQEFAGAGASREEMHALHQAVNPNNTLKGAMADIAGLEATHQWYIQHGMPVEADKAAAGIMMASRNAAANWGDQAVKEIYGGNSEKAIEAIKKGYDSIPDGGTLDVVDNKDGSYTVSQKNMSHRVTWQGTVGPSEIMSAAIGLKDGSMAWKLMGEAARKFDPQGQTEAQQVSPGTQAEIAKLYAPPGGGGQAPPQQGITTTPAAAPGQAPAPAQVTPQGNPPQQAVATGPVTATPPNPFAGRPIPSQISSGQAIPTDPNAPAPGVSEAGFNIPDLPQSVLDAHQKNLDGQLSQLQAQILGPAMAQDPRTPAAIGFLNSLPEGSPDRKAYTEALLNRAKEWQSGVMAPAQARYNEEQKAIRDQYRSDLTGARQAVRTEAQARAADLRSQQAQALQDERLKASQEREGQRDTANADRDFQIRMVDRPVPAELAVLRDPKDLTISNAFGGNVYAKFQPDEREGIRNGAINIGRLNGLEADTAANVANKIVMDPADDMKDMMYKATPLPKFAGGASGTYVRLTPQKPSANLPEVVMPASAYINLMTARSQLAGRIDMAKTTAGEKQLRQEGRATRDETFQDRLEKKLAVPQGVTPLGNYVPVIDRSPGPRQGIPTQ